MSESQEGYQDGQLDYDPDSSASSFKKKDLHIWAYYFPTLNFLSIAAGADEITAKGRAMARALFSHPRRPREKKLTMQYLAEEIILIKTTHPSYKDRFNGILHTGRVNPKSVSRTYELLYGMRDDFRKQPDEWTGFQEYCEYLYDNLHRCGPFPFTREDAETPA